MKELIKLALLIVGLLGCRFAVAKDVAESVGSGDECEAYYRWKAGLQVAPQVALVAAEVAREIGAEQPEVHFLRHARHRNCWKHAATVLRVRKHPLRGPLGMGILLDLQLDVGVTAGTLAQILLMVRMHLNEVHGRPDELPKWARQAEDMFALGMTDTYWRQLPWKFHGEVLALRLDGLVNGTVEALYISAASAGTSSCLALLEEVRSQVERESAIEVIESLIPACHQANESSFEGGGLR